MLLPWWAALGWLSPSPSCSACYTPEAGRSSQAGGWLRGGTGFCQQPGTQETARLLMEVRGQVGGSLTCGWPCRSPQLSGLPCEG